MTPPPPLGYFSHTTLPKGALSQLANSQLVKHCHHLNAARNRIERRPDRVGVQTQKAVVSSSVINLSPQDSILILTALLLLVTGWYAFDTRRVANASGRAADAAEASAKAASRATTASVDALVCNAVQPVTPGPETGR